MSSLSALVDATIARTVELAAVPGPPLDEADRAAVVRAWWTSDGLEAVTTDGTGNVWSRLRAGGSPAVVVCAHLDTVFDRSVAHHVRRDGPYLHGPSVGDDSVAVASLAALDHLLPAETERAVWLLATVGEEGMGNLAGVRAALAEPMAPVGVLLALEGNWLGRVCRVGVGSVRWRVEVRGPGGHAWESADAPSAVHVVGQIIAGLESLRRPDGARTSLNIGRVSGGESINSRAVDAWLEIDIRAESQDALDELAGAARDSIAVHRTDDVTVVFQEIGDRPAGSLDADHPVVLAAVEALAAIGYEAELTAASTDANAAHALGIPAVALGVTLGAGTHTELEWIDVRPLGDGLRALADTVTRLAEVTD